MALPHGVLAWEDPCTHRDHEPAAAPHRVRAAKRHDSVNEWHKSDEVSWESPKGVRRALGATHQTRGMGWGRILLASLAASLIVSQVSAGFSLPFQGRRAVRVAELARAEPAGQGGGLRGIDKVAKMGGYVAPS